VARIPNIRAGAYAVLAAAVTVLTVLTVLASTASAAPSAATIYKEAVATTNGWRVHYVSTSNVSNVPFFESGDAGPASGTQTILVGKGATLDSASLVVIGDLTYVKGNQHAMEDLAGLSPKDAAAAMGHWVLFSSDNPDFSQVVVGVRSHDVAQEIALQGPVTFGPSKELHGYRVDALRGTQKFQGTKAMRAVLYVRASGQHIVVEEDTVDTQGAANGIEHIVFSKWGEPVKPRAPDASLTIGSINAT